MPAIKKAVRALSTAFGSGRRSSSKKDDKPKEKVFKYDDTYPDTMWVIADTRPQPDGITRWAMYRTEKELREALTDGHVVAQYERVCVGRVESHIVPTNVTEEEYK